MVSVITNTEVSTSRPACKLLLTSKQTSITSSYPSTSRQENRDRTHTHAHAHVSSHVLADQQLTSLRPSDLPTDQQLITGFLIT